MQIKIEYGTRRTEYTSTFPARRYWVRHDSVIVDGVKLEGTIQTRSRSGRVDVMTAHKDSCVLGFAPDWLARMNGGN